VDGTYVAPGQTVKPDFYTVPQSVLIFASVLWISLLYFSYVAPTIPALKSTAFIPEHLAKNILFVVGVIHAAEMIAIMGICIWSQMPIEMGLKYGLMTFFGGLPAFKEGMRGSFHFRRDVEDKEQIKIR
jgi:hypothetical protein